MATMRERVLLRMKELNLNTTQLARKMGRYQSTLRGFLTGKTKTFRDIAGLSQALETTPQWLITGKEGPLFCSPPYLAQGAAEALTVPQRDPRLVAAAKSLAVVVVERAKRDAQATFPNETGALQRMTSYILADFERGTEADVGLLTEIARLLLEGGK